MKRLKDCIRSIIENIKILMILKGNRKTTEYEDSIAIVKLDAIGDFVLWLDAAKGLRSMYKDKKIILVCNELCAGLAGKLSYFDEVFPINTSRIMRIKNWSAGSRIRKMLKNYKVEKVIQTVYERTLVMDYVVAAIYAKEKVTIEAPSNVSKERKLYKTDQIYDTHIHTTDGWCMELQRNAELIRGLGNKEFRSDVPVIPKLPIDTTIVPKTPYFVVFPGGSYSKKLWSTENFAYIADKIAGKMNWSCCICGAPNEAELAEQIIRKVNSQVDIINLVGKTSIVELVEVIRQASFIISNDTSGIHIGAAVDTPAVCLLGGWHYERFLPYAVEKKTKRNLPVVCCKKMDCFLCDYAHTSYCEEYTNENEVFPCIGQIDKEYVWDVIEEILEQ